jgi:mono/diheme cytochrome c family protein
MIGRGKLAYLRVYAAVATILANVPAMAADPHNGERLAHRWCEACHVVSSTQRRPGSDQAPPFSTIAKMPHFGASEIALYLLRPHPQMPDMNLTRIEAGDLAAYISTLK